MPVLTILGTPIAFPDDQASPDWSAAVIQFAQLTAQALNLAIGPFDVPPQTYTMISNANTDVPLNALSFPTASVRAAFIRYSIFRTTSTTTAYEAGVMTVVYNPNGTPGSLWELIQYKEGNAQVTFNITDTGQVEFSSIPISGLNAAGTISFAAQTLLQS